MNIPDIRVQWGDRRITFFREGGVSLECYLEGPGWIVDDDPNDEQGQGFPLLMALRTLRQRLDRF